MLTLSAECSLPLTPCKWFPTAYHPRLPSRDYDSWREALPPSDAAKWRAKYYKGLGTSTPRDEPRARPTSTMLEIGWPFPLRAALPLAPARPRARAKAH